MRVAVVYNQVSRDSPDARDVLVQAKEVSCALERLGHRVHRLSCGLDLDTMRKQLATSRTDLVFNLVEDLHGWGRLIHLFPYLLDAMGLPYTGSPADAILATTHKTRAKEALLAAELPTPDWFGPLPSRRPLRALRHGMERTWILKSLWEHASLGIGPDSLLTTGSAEVLQNELGERRHSLGGQCFAEEYIDGREFNLSLLATDEGARVLAPAEIVFENFGPEAARIVDYQAKWEEDSFAFQHTPRSFDFPESDATLLDQLKNIALGCWHLFGLGGYARVDFRVDRQGRPYVLEVNANPCLSPDAGFAAALTREKISYEEAVEAIVADALRSHQRPRGTAEN